LPNKYCRTRIVEQILPNKYCRTNIAEAHARDKKTAFRCSLSCPPDCGALGQTQTPDIHHHEAVPAYFTHFRRLLGSKSVEVEQGHG
jgi:hypothetical protein